jgi:hypothetical protein
VIQLLLRCYPARWRARYGDEFASILEERQLGPFDVADILLGALDAQLHLRGMGAASQHQKGFAMSLRIGGYAAILSGFLWLVILAANAINNGAESGIPWIGPVLVAAVIVTVVALVGLSAFQARQYPVLTWSAFAIPALGGVVSLLATVAIAVNGDSDRAVFADLSGWALAMLGLMALLVGSGLFALATWRTRSLSRAAAALLMVGVITTIVTLGGASGGIFPEPILPLVIVAMVLLYPGGWVALGVSALRVGRPVASLEGAPL